MEYNRVYGIVNTTTQHHGKQILSVFACYCFALGALRFGILNCVSFDNQKCVFSVQSPCKGRSSEKRDEPGAIPVQKKCTGVQDGDVDKEARSTNGAKSQKLPDIHPDI